MRDQFFAKTMSLLWSLSNEEWLRFMHVNNYRVIWRSLSHQPIDRLVLSVDILKKEPSKELKEAMALKTKYFDLIN